VVLWQPREKADAENVHSNRDPILRAISRPTARRAVEKDCYRLFSPDDNKVKARLFRHRNRGAICGMLLNALPFGYLF
jgi:hypothetical protein